MYKKCSDRFGFGCTNSMEAEDIEDFTRMFRAVPTHTGTYLLNYCRECEAKKQNQRYHKCKYKNISAPDEHLLLLKEFDEGD